MAPHYCLSRGYVEVVIGYSFVVHSYICGIFKEIVKWPEDMHQAIIISPIFIAKGRSVVLCW